MISTTSWQPADGLVLEPGALQAVREEKTCLALTAGPGAGKTEMLAQRADFLLRTGTSRYPKRLLAISFKVDASKNLKERVQRRCGRELAARFDSYTFHGFAKRIIDRFRPVLIGKDALDINYTIGRPRVSRKQIEFEDIIPLAIQILKDSTQARRALRQAYTDVFLDEFQDCTGAQYELIKIAFHGTSIRLTAVGDTKQKIMGWAGALEGIFGKFASDFDAMPLNLYRNFRSKPRLLQLQNEIIAVLDPTSVMPKEQLQGDEGEIITYHFNDNLKEAKFLADSILHWVSHEQIPYSEIAILVCRQLDLYAKSLMIELDTRGIPYRNEQQLQDITVEPITRFIVDYLQCIYGEKEPKAWVRLMNQLIPFIEETIQTNSLRKIQSFINKKMREIKSLANHESTPQWQEDVDEFLAFIGKETITALSPDYESSSRIDEIINNTKKHLEDLLLQENDLLKVLLKFSDDQAIRILTIHKSKGLEFDTVVILGVENETFWGRPDEQRCLFFVGVSRAKRKLILTYANQREKPAEYSGMWRATRHPQEEYLGYTHSFANQSEA